MSSKLCQSGLDDAERDRAATVGRCSGGSTGVTCQHSPHRRLGERERCQESDRGMERGPVSQRPPQDGLQRLSDGTVNIRTGLADVGGRTGENDIGKLGEGG